MKRTSKDPCKCCTRTELSVCRKLAIKENWDSILKITKPFKSKIKK